MANYTVDNAYNLFADWMSARTNLANLGDSTGEVFLTMASIFKKNFYQEARKIDPTIFQVVSTAVVNGLTEFEITDFESFNGNGCGVFEEDDVGLITDTELYRTGRGSQDNGYWWDSKEGKLKFTGNLNETVFVVYLPTFTRPTTSGSDLLVPENNDEFVLNYFQRLYGLWDFNGTGGGKISLADQQLANSMARIIENIRVYSGYGLPTNSAHFG